MYRSRLSISIRMDAIHWLLRCYPIDPLAHNPILQRSHTLHTRAYQLDRILNTTLGKQGSKSSSLSVALFQFSRWNMYSKLFWQDRRCRTIICILVSISSRRFASQFVGQHFLLLHGVLIAMHRWCWCWMGRLSLKEQFQYLSQTILMFPISHPRFLSRMWRMKCKYLVCCRLWFLPQISRKGRFRESSLHQNTSYHPTRLKPH